MCKTICLKVDPEANLTTQDKIFLANVEEVRQQTNIAPEFWKYVNDSAFFSETDMTLVQVFATQMIQIQVKIIC